MMMAPSAQKVAVTLVLISCLPFPPSKSVGLQFSSYSKSLGEQKKMVLGSRPPGCVNKCKNCRPCMATLVIPPHDDHRKGFKESSHGGDDSYYLLSWKCRCGNKLYQP